MGDFFEADTVRRIRQQYDCSKKLPKDFENTIQNSKFMRIPSRGPPVSDYNPQIAVRIATTAMEEEKSAASCCSRNGGGGGTPTIYLKMTINPIVTGGWIVADGWFFSGAMNVTAARFFGESGRTEKGSLYGGYLFDI